MNDARPLTICYFGCFKPAFSRNGVYRAALRATGEVEIVDCIDTAPGLRKYWNLYRKHRALAGSYTVLVVGYPGQAVAWLARLVSTGPVVLDALASLYESEILSRHPEKRRSLFALKMWLTDWLAYCAADLVLVETEAQRAYFRKTFFVPLVKTRRVFTGCDESVFAYDSRIRKREAFTVVFRGRFLPEAGVQHLLAAAKLLAHENIRFLILGTGLLLPAIERQVRELALPNVELDTKKHDAHELARLMQECHVSIGQLEVHERLMRTIPHKAFESAAMKLPYITARTPAIAELFEDGESALMIEPGNPADLAENILRLYRDAALRGRLAEAAYRAYEERAGQAVLGGELFAILREVSNR